MRHLFLIPLLLFTFQIALYSEKTKSKCFKRSYEKSDKVTEEVWDTLKPYFLPGNHPAKKGLDELFSSPKRVLQNENSLKKAGFKHTSPRKYSKLIVSTHPKIPGYYFKFFKDDQLNIDDGIKLFQRLSGALNVRDWIKENGYEDIIKVPTKWIYPIPLFPPAEKGTQQKYFILVAEDMDLLAQTSNLTEWKKDTLPKRTIEAIFFLIKDLGLRDSTYPFNLPFAKDGKIAVIDTEHHHEWPIPFRLLGKYLSKQNRIYWSELLKSHGVE